MSITKITCKYKMFILYSLSLLYLIQYSKTETLSESDAINNMVNALMRKIDMKNAESTEFSWNRGNLGKDDEIKVTLYRQLLRSSKAPFDDNDRAFGKKKNCATLKLKDFFDDYNKLRQTTRSQYENKNDDRSLKHDSQTKNRIANHSMKMKTHKNKVNPSTIKMKPPVTKQTDQTTSSTAASRPSLTTSANNISKKPSHKELIFGRHGPHDNQVFSHSIFEANEAISKSNPAVTTSTYRTTQQSSTTKENNTQIHNNVNMNKVKNTLFQEENTTPGASKINDISANTQDNSNLNIEDDKITISYPSFKINDDKNTLSKKFKIYDDTVTVSTNIKNYDDVHTVPSKLNIEDDINTISAILKIEDSKYIISTKFNIEDGTLAIPTKPKKYYSSTTASTNNLAAIKAIEDRLKNVPNYEKDPYDISSVINIIKNIPNYKKDPYHTSTENNVKLSSYDHDLGNGNHKLSEVVRHDLEDLMKTIKTKHYKSRKNTELVNDYTPSTDADVYLTVDPNSNFLKGFITISPYESTIYQHASKDKQTSTSRQTTIKDLITDFTTELDKMEKRIESTQIQDMKVPVTKPTEATKLTEKTKAAKLTDITKPAQLSKIRKPVKLTEIIKTANQIKDTSSNHADILAELSKSISEILSTVKSVFGPTPVTQNPHKKVKHSSWEKVKKFFGHDRVCNCKCKANKTICTVCAASDAVIRELQFEFNNLANYMNEHCTEIQTYFWMNPSGGRKLRDSVHRIDKSLQDYYKRVKGKCSGRTCKTFATYLDKRNLGKKKINRKDIDNYLNRNLMLS